MKDLWEGQEHNGWTKKWKEKEDVEKTDGFDTV